MTIRSSLWRASAALSALCLAFVVAACSPTSTRLQPAGVPYAEQRATQIDLPAVDRVVPADAVVNVKTRYGAVGDGVTDDTQALQNAISAGLGLDNPNKMLFLPVGTYLVSRPLEWRLADGRWSTALTLMGESRDKTVIKLADGAPGFGDVERPRGILVTGSQNADSADGSGNQAFHNFIFDLTVDAGAENIGADGIQLLANNRGALRNVVVRSATNAGGTGISMTRRWPGPALLSDVRVSGFARGILMTSAQYSMTAEHVRLSGQGVVGVENRGNVLAVRDLISDNTVTALRNGVPENPTLGLLVVVGARLRGGSPDVPGVASVGTAALRNIVVSGYSGFFDNNGGKEPVPGDGDWSSQDATNGSFAQSPPLLTPVDHPLPPPMQLDQWISVGEFGAVPDDDGDDTDAIQRALDSGRPVVYLRAGTYRASQTLAIPPTVRMIVGFEAHVRAEGGVFAQQSPSAVLQLKGTSSTPFFLTQLSILAPEGVFDINRSGTRPIVLTDVHLGGAALGGSSGDVFLSDIAGGDGWRFTRGDRVWARQLNVEQPDTKIQNDGARLWILGLKTESTGTVVDSSSGAATEVLGALLYPTQPVDVLTPAFSAVDARIELMFTVIADRASDGYPVLAVFQCGAGPAQRLHPVPGTKSSIIRYDQQPCSPTVTHN